MYFKKLALSAAVASAIGVTALPTHAAVTGLAGEAGLVPAVLNIDGGTNTYVVLRLPSRLGGDFVLNNYTTPNLRAGLANDQTKVMDPAEWEVHWTWFDQESKNPINGTCEGSPDDVIVWTTDEELLDLQQETDRTFVPIASGQVPKTYCGNANLPEAGYVVFQTYAGADSLAADFAIEGTAYIVDNIIAVNKPALLSVPFVPMADGEDDAPSDEDSSPRLGLNEVIQPLSSGGGQKGDGTLISPVVASPLGAGIRMNDGDPTTTLFQVIAGGVQGDYQPPAFSMHVLWFDRNNDARTSSSQVLLWDEHENPESLQVPIDDELNIIVWNSSIEAGVLVPTAESYTNLLTADSRVFNAPANWDLSIMGVAEYNIREEGTELGGAGGTPGVNASAVAFEAQEDLYNGDAWTHHAMTNRGWQ